MRCARSRIATAMAQQAREMLNQIYPWLDQRLEGRHWIAGADFTLAGAPQPSLFYADWAHEIPAGYGRLRAYRARLLNHPLHRAGGGGGEAISTLLPLGAQRVIEQDDFVVGEALPPQAMCEADRDMALSIAGETAIFIQMSGYAFMADISREFLNVDA